MAEMGGEEKLGRGPKGPDKGKENLEARIIDASGIYEKGLNDRGMDEGRASMLAEAFRTTLTVNLLIELGERDPARIAELSLASYDRIHGKPEKTG